MLWQRVRERVLFSHSQSPLWASNATELFKKKKSKKGEKKEKKERLCVVT